MKELTDEQKVTLLRLARTTIARELQLQDACGDLCFDDGAYRQVCGAFVTLHASGKLRGCIGCIVGVKPIPETVAEMARSSAFRDPRFMPLRQEEYGRIDIEISILTPIVPVTDVRDIEVGRDGLIVTRGFRSGLLLPQVPVEQGWDRDTFLEHTCYKAGLPGNAWKQPDTKLEKFSALVFGEKELGLAV